MSAADRALTRHGTTAATSSPANTGSRRVLGQRRELDRRNKIKENCIKHVKEKTIRETPEALLPADWEAYRNPNATSSLDRLYYYNKIEGVTQWHHPSRSANEEASSSSSGSSRGRARRLSDEGKGLLSSAMAAALPIDAGPARKPHGVVRREAPRGGSGGRHGSMDVTEGAFQVQGPSSPTSSQILG